MFFSFSPVEDVNLERGTETIVQAQVENMHIHASMGGAEPEDKASAVDDGVAFEENADVDDGGADAVLCVSM